MNLELRLSRLEETILGESSDDPIKTSKQLLQLVKRNPYFKKILELGYEVDPLIPARNNRGHVVFRSSYGDVMRYPEPGMPYPGGSSSSWNPDPYMDSKDRVIMIKADESSVVTAIIWSKHPTRSGANLIKRYGGKSIWKTLSDTEGTKKYYREIKESDIPDIMETIYLYCKKMKNKRI